MVDVKSDNLLENSAVKDTIIDNIGSQETSESEASPGLSLKDIDASNMVLTNLYDIPCYLYNDGESEKYLTLEGKEFSDEASFREEYKMNLKSLSAEEIIKATESKDTENSDEIDIIDSIIKLITPHIYLEDEHEYTLLAIYATMTYCYQLFNRIPYLSLRGMKGSGKTTVMEILNQLARNPKFSTNLTPAALFRIIEQYKPTLLIDEVEALSSKTSGNSPIIQILNSGYQKDGKVSRVSGSRTEEFSTYGPKIIAGINELPAATEDRCIKVTMQRAAKDLKPFNSTLEEMKTIQAIRDGIILILNRHASKILDYKTGRETLTIDSAIMNRDKDLWFPILVLAKIFEHGNSNYFEQMMKLALKHVNKKKVIESQLPENMAKSIIEQGIKAKKIEIVFSDKTRQYVKSDTVFELVEKDDLFNSYKSKAELTNVLKKLGIEALRRRIEGKLTPLYKLPLQFN